MQESLAINYLGFEDAEAKRDLINRLLITSSASEIYNICAALPLFIDQEVIASLQQSEIQENVNKLAGLIYAIGRTKDSKFISYISGFLDDDRKQVVYSTITALSRLSLDGTKELVEKKIDLTERMARKRYIEAFVEYEKSNPNPGIGFYHVRDRKFIEQLIENPSMKKQESIVPSSKEVVSISAVMGEFAGQAILYSYGILTGVLSSALSSALYDYLKHLATKLPEARKKNETPRINNAMAQLFAERRLKKLGISGYKLIRNFEYDQGEDMLEHPNCYFFEYEADKKLVRCIVSNFGEVKERVYENTH